MRGTTQPAQGTRCPSGAVRAAIRGTVPRDPNSAIESAPGASLDPFGDRAARLRFDHRATAAGTAGGGALGGVVDSGGTDDDRPGGRGRSRVDLVDDRRPPSPWSRAIARRTQSVMLGEAHGDYLTGESKKEGSGSGPAQTSDATESSSVADAEVAEHNPQFRETAQGGQDLTEAIDKLEADIASLLNLDLDTAGVSVCESAYARIEQSKRQLSATQTLLYSSIQKRRSEFVQHMRPDDPRAADRAKRKLSQDLQQRNRQTPSEIGQIDKTAEQLDATSSPVRDAFLSGTITSRHVQLIGETLQGLDDDIREGVEASLLEAATTMDTREFSKECRRRLAAVAYPKAVDQQRARHERRSLKLSAGDDGMLYISGRLTGIDAETVATAIHHFRQPDPAGTPASQARTSEQATADGFAQLCDTAIRHTNSTTHGHPPQIIVTIDYKTLLAEAGVAEAIHSGPIPFDEIRRLLADAGVARILTDANSVPVEAGEMVRTVPAGLWRMLLVRDRGCVGDGCDAPPAWCDVAHLREPFRKKGRLSRDNAAMACRLHHRLFDDESWTFTWNDGRPIIHHPSRPPRGNPPGGPSPGGKPTRGQSPGGRPPSGPSSGGPSPGGKQPGGPSPGRKPSAGKPPGGRSPGEKPPDGSSASGPSSGGKPSNGRSQGGEPSGGPSSHRIPPGRPASSSRASNGSPSGGRRPHGPPSHEQAGLFATDVGDDDWPSSAREQGHGYDPQTIHGGGGVRQGQVQPT